MFYTYILKSVSTEKIYIGQTNNLKERISKHNNNEVISTKNRGPWEILFSKQFESRSQAMEFEKYLKSLKNRKYLFDKIQDTTLKNMPEKSR